MITHKSLNTFIDAALKEDIGTGDHSTMACIPPDTEGRAVLKIKEDGILAGIEIAKSIFQYLEEDNSFTAFKKDGDAMKAGEKAFEVAGKVHTILQAERLALNCMQRMSGIATLTKKYTEKIKNFPTKLLDTRKTTPNFRLLEKEAVLIGGGYNHRMGLYDMIMLKDNHIDFSGGILQAIRRVKKYLQTNHLNIPVEVEARSIKEVQEIISIGKIQRIMLDNFSPDEAAEAVRIIDGRYETESSGGITLDSIEDYARAGVDFISAGAIIHHATSLDLSLKAEFI